MGLHSSGPLRRPLFFFFFFFFFRNSVTELSSDPCLIKKDPPDIKDVAPHRAICHQTVDVMEFSSQSGVDFLKNVCLFLSFLCSLLGE